MQNALAEGLTPTEQSQTVLKEFGKFVDLLFFFCLFSSDERFFTEPPARHWVEGIQLRDRREAKSLPLTHQQKAKRACCAIWGL